MRIVLMVVWLISWLGWLLSIVFAHSAFQETSANLLLVNGTVALGFAAMLEARASRSPGVKPVSDLEAG